MGINIPLAQAAEKIAKEIAKKKLGNPELWELFLIEAYDKLRQEK